MYTVQHRAKVMVTVNFHFIYFQNVRKIDLVTNARQGVFVDFLYTILMNVIILMATGPVHIKDVLAYFVTRVSEYFLFFRVTRA